MARTPTIHREAQQTESPNTFGQLSLGAKGSGYTFTRALFTVEFHTDIPAPQELLSNQPSVFGVIFTQGNPAPDPPFPIDTPDAEWLWWERWYWQADRHEEDLWGYTRYVMRNGGVTREINGQRKVTATEGRLWLVWQAPSWPVFYAAVGITTVWLEP